MRAIKEVWASFRKSDIFQGDVTVVDIDCTQLVMFGYHKEGVTFVGQ